MWSESENGIGNNKNIPTRSSLKGKWEWKSSPRSSKLERFETQFSRKIDTGTTGSVKNESEYNFKTSWEFSVESKQLFHLSTMITKN